MVLFICRSIHTVWTGQRRVTSWVSRSGLPLSLPPPALLTPMKVLWPSWLKWTDCSTTKEVFNRAVNEPSWSFMVPEEGPSLLKAPTSVFTIKNTFRHHAKQTFKHALCPEEAPNRAFWLLKVPQFYIYLPWLNDCSPKIHNCESTTSMHFQ